jgi:hypothetical protein
VTISDDLASRTARSHRRACARRVHDALAELEIQRGRQYMLTLGFTLQVVADNAGLMTDDALTGLHDLRHRRLVIPVDDGHGLWTLHPACGDRSAA